MISITIDAVGILAGNWQWFATSTIVSIILLLLAWASFEDDAYKRDPYYHWAWSHGKWSEITKRWEPATPPTNYFGNIVFFPALALTITSPILATAGMFVALWLTIFG